MHSPGQGTPLCHPRGSQEKTQRLPAHPQRAEARTFLGTLQHVAQRPSTKHPRPSVSSETDALVLDCCGHYEWGSHSPAARD